MGILGRGLKIAPPEAPSTGYMFGKGVYFADCASKSANYTYPTSNDNVGIMALCEVGHGSFNFSICIGLWTLILSSRVWNISTKRIIWNSCIQLCTCNSFYVFYAILSHGALRLEAMNANPTVRLYLFHVITDAMWVSRVPFYYLIRIFARGFLWWDCGGHSGTGELLVQTSTWVPISCHTVGYKCMHGV